MMFIFSLLSQIIAKLKKGETIDDAEVEETTQVCKLNSLSFFWRPLLQQILYSQRNYNVSLCKYGLKS